MDNLLVPHLQVNPTHPHSHTTPHPLGKFVCIVIFNLYITGSGKMGKMIIKRNA